MLTTPYKLTSINGLIDEMCSSYKHGKSVIKLAKKYKCDQKTIYYHLKRNGIRRNRKPLLELNENYFSKINTPNKAYILGFLYADGSVFNRTLSLGLSVRDINHLIRIKREIGFGGKLYYDIKSYKKKRYRVVTLKITRKKLVNNLIKLGCFYKKTFTLKFPNSKQLPSKFLSHFIRGYFDGDGMVSIGGNCKRPGQAQLSVAIISSEDFIKKLSKILQKKCNIIGYATNNIKGKTISSFRITGNNSCRNIYNFLYKKTTPEVLFLARKRNIFEKMFYILDKVKNEREILLDDYEPKIRTVKLSKSIKKFIA